MSAPSITRPAKRRHTQTHPTAPPRPTRPQRSPADPGRSTSPTSPPTTRPPTRPARAPFVLLILGLLAGGLVCLLMLNTVLNQGSFTLESLREHHTELTHKKEALVQEVTYQQSPEMLAQKAKSLGMVPTDETNFVRPKGRGGAEHGAPAHRSGGE